jgi:hypothetical protein
MSKLSHSHLRRRIGTRADTRVHFLFVSLLISFGATHVSAASTSAVLAVDASRIDGEQAPLATADTLRTQLSSSGSQLLSAADVIKRLTDVGVPSSQAVDVSRTVSEAEAAYQAVDPERSVALLERAIAALVSAPVVTPKDAALLEDLRVRMAVRLLAVAGPDESGNGESTAGRRAKVVLQDALRANPTLALDAAKHPPKARRLLDEARLELSRAGAAGLTVDSVPEGATVFVEGRAVGKTPLALVDALSPGRYRVWVEDAGVRSRTRVVDVQKDTPAVVIDLAFEGALDASAPSLRPLAGQTVDDRMAARVGALLGVDELILCGIARYDDARWLYTVVFSVAEGTAMRRGAVRIVGEAPSETEVASLAAFLNERAPLDDRPVPSTILPKAAASAAAAVETADDARLVSAAPSSMNASEAGDDAGMPWAVIGITAGIAGALVVVAAGVVTGVVVFMSLNTPEPDPVGRFDVVIE